MSKKDANTTDTTREQQLLDQLKRARADYSNLEKRVEREKEAFRKFANESLLLQISQIVNGLEMSMRELNKLLELSGFSKVEVKIGDEFDPNFMDAIEAKSDGTKVIEVFAPAYKLHDKIVQPAKVKVGKEVEDKR